MYRKILNIVDNRSTLKQRSASFPEFESWSESEFSAIADLEDTFNVVQGLGLAAPQIGIFKRAVVISPKRLGLDEETEKLLLINPTIETYGDLEAGPEACFSVPGVTGKVERPQSCTVKYVTGKGEQGVLETTGFPAVCLQHEIDHLDGILYIDRMGPLSRKMLLKKVQKHEKRKREAERLARKSFEDDHREIMGTSPQRKKTTHSKKRKPKSRKPKQKRAKKGKK